MTGKLVRVREETIEAARETLAGLKGVAQPLLTRFVRCLCEDIVAAADGSDVDHHGRGNCGNTDEKRVLVEERHGDRLTCHVESMVDGDSETAGEVTTVKKLPLKGDFAGRLQWLLDQLGGGWFGRPEVEALKRICATEKLKARVDDYERLHEASHQPAEQPEPGSMPGVGEPVEVRRVDPATGVPGPWRPAKVRGYMPSGYGVGFFADSKDLVQIECFAFLEGKTWRRVKPAEAKKPNEHVEDAVRYSLRVPLQTPINDSQASSTQMALGFSHDGGGPRACVPVEVQAGQEDKTIAECQKLLTDRHEIIKRMGDQYEANQKTIELAEAEKASELAGEVTTDGLDKWCEANNVSEGTWKELRVACGRDVARATEADKKMIADLQRLLAESRDKADLESMKAKASLARHDGEVDELQRQLARAEAMNRRQAEDIGALARILMRDGTAFAHAGVSPTVEAATRIAELKMALDGARNELAVVREDFARWAKFKQHHACDPLTEAEIIEVAELERQLARAEAERDQAQSDRLKDRAKLDRRTELLKQRMRGRDSGWSAGQVFDWQTKAEREIAGRELAKQLTRLANEAIEAKSSLAEKPSAVTTHVCNGCENQCDCPHPGPDGDDCECRNGPCKYSTAAMDALLGKSECSFDDIRDAETDAETMLEHEDPARPVLIIINEP